MSQENISIRWVIRKTKNEKEVTLNKIDEKQMKNNLKTVEMKGVMEEKIGKAEHFNRNLFGTENLTNLTGRSDASTKSLLNSLHSFWRSVCCNRGRHSFLISIYLPTLPLPYLIQPISPLLYPHHFATKIRHLPILLALMTI